MPDDQFIRDPDSVLDFRWDWSEWLSSGENIIEAILIVSAGLTLDSSSHTDTTVTAWLSGGTVDDLYAATCRISTNQGRIDDRTIWLVTRQR